MVANRYDSPYRLRRPSRVTGPAGEKWEVYTVLADSETFGTSPNTPRRTAEGGICCGGTKSAGYETQPTSAAACC
jgi:lactoylglutathione lyase